MRPSCSSADSGDDFITAEQWFASGRRVHFDPKRKRILSNAHAGTISVFERVRLPRNSSSLPHRETLWLTLLPSFAAGSYGYANVDPLLEQRRSIVTPRLFVEYVGQGDSDKPAKNYEYSTMERADLVQAQWMAHGIKRTVIVALDYSSLVVMELLRRHQENNNSQSAYTKIEHVLIVSGGLFADGQAHPWTTIPRFRTTCGKIRTSLAQYCNITFNLVLRKLYSKSTFCNRTEQRKKELVEIKKAIRRHNGTSFLSKAATFVDEHQKYAERWNMCTICADHTDITFHLLGDERDPFDQRQINLAQQRLQYPHVRAEFLGGGSTTVSGSSASAAAAANSSTTPLSQQPAGGGLIELIEGLTLRKTFEFTTPTADSVIPSTISSSRSLVNQ